MKEYYIKKLDNGWFVEIYIPAQIVKTFAFKTLEEIFEQINIENKNEV